MHNNKYLQRKKVSRRNVKIIVTLIVFILLIITPISAIPTNTSIIGFRWDTSSDNPVLSQINSAGNVVTVPATFWTDHVIWGNMKTVLVAANNSIYYGSNNRGDGLTLDGTQGDVMVEIPKFWVCSTYSNPYFYYYISPAATAGYEVAPMFNQRMPSGVTTPAPYYYVARYDANDGGSSKLQSATGKAPLVSQTIGTFRSRAENKGSGWGITNIWTLSGIRQLFYTEMLTLNSQTAWANSRGVVDQGAAENSGADSADSNIYATNATGGGTGTNGQTPVVYRGMENLWGNIYQFQDGFNAVQGTTNIITKTGFNSSGGRTTFKDLMFTTDVENVGSLLIADGYQSNLMNTDATRGLFLPSSVTGGTDTKYLADYYYYPRSTNAAAPNILLSGGDWGAAGYAGLGYLGAHSDASLSIAAVGARLEFRPLVVAPLGNADFDTTPQIGSQYGLKVFFKENSTFPATQAWNWTFGDGYTSQERNPTHIYAVAGKYDVNLTVINGSTSYYTLKTQNVNLTADFDSYVKTRMHMYGLNGGTTFKDEAGIAWSPTSVTTSTTQYKWNATSGYFSSALSKLTTPSNTAFNLGTIENNNFTWEGWVYPTEDGVNRATLISRSSGGNNVVNGWGIYHGAGTANADWKFWMGSQATGSTSAFSLAKNTWHYLVVEGVKGNVSIYRNGTYLSSKTYTGNFDTANPLIYGDVDVHTTSFRGYLDEPTLSTEKRFGEPHSPPYAEYKGILETIYPDINPSSTLRFKTDPGGYAPIFNQTAGGMRNRTVQIQNIVNTSYITATLIYQPEYLQFKQFFVNSSTYSGISIVSSSNDPVEGTATFNITRAAGFPIGTSRASVIDAQFLYYSYADPSVLKREFFGSGYLINGTTSKTYPIHNFIETDLTFGNWGTFIVDFNANKTVTPAGSNVLFTSTTTNYPNRYDWDYGDSSTEIGLQIPTANHTYAAPGFYSVKLKTYLYQNASVTNETTKTNYIQVFSTSPPVANFVSNITQSTIPTAIAFNDTSTGYNNSAWLWNFGDTTTSTLQNVTHTYNAAGTYTVILTTTNDYGSDGETKTNYITAHAPAVANFARSNTSGVPPLPVLFTDTSTGYGIVGWQWDFGDGTNSTDQNPPVHTYPIEGEFQINLTIQNDRGYSTKLQNVSVNLFSADFTANHYNGLPPLAVSFTDTTVGMIPDTWNWIFGDGNVSTLQNPSNTFVNPGTYHVNLTATNGTLLSTKIKDIQLFNYPPVANFVASNWSDDSPLITTFTDTSTGLNITQWHWDFGNGITSILQNPPTQTYVAYQGYTVNLTVTNDGGSSTKLQNVTVGTSPPISNFTATPTTVYLGNATQFTYTGYNATSWAWDFGDGSATNTLTNPLYTYTTLGLKTVTLTVTNSLGTDTKTRVDYITVNAAPAPANPPIASFVASPLSGTIGTTIGFYDTSANTPTSWAWNFGDGATSTLKNPTHAYATAGLKTITLVATNVHGSDTLIKPNYVTITLPPAPVADFTGSPTSVNLGSAVTFTDISTNSPTSWLWNFGDGITSTAQNPLHAYSTLGAKTVTLTATNPGGSDSEVKIGYITVIIPPTATPVTSYVITNPATAISNSTVTMNGYTASPSYKYYFEYGLYPGVYAYATSQKTGTSTGNFSETVSGLPLMADETYYYRAVIKENNAYISGGELSYDLGQSPLLDTYPEYKTRGDNLVESNWDFDTLLVVIPSPFVDLMGSIFYGIIIGGAFILLWARTKKIVIPALFGILSGGVLWNILPPSWVAFGSTLFYISIAGFLYGIIVGRQS